MSHRWQDRSMELLLIAFHFQRRNVQQVSHTSKEYNNLWPALLSLRLCLNFHHSISSNFNLYEVLNKALIFMVCFYFQKDSHLVYLLRQYYEIFANNSVVRLIVTVNFEIKHYSPKRMELENFPTFNYFNLIHAHHQDAFSNYPQQYIDLNDHQVSQND